MNNDNIRSTGPSCHGCPIYTKTGKDLCKGTLLPEVWKRQEAFKTAQRAVEERRRDFRYAVKEHLRFLRDIYEEFYGEPKETNNG